MNNLKGYVLAAVGIVSLTASIAINVVRANNAQASTVISSTDHFKVGSSYQFYPVNSTGSIRCKITQVDGDWVVCEGSNEWLNTNAMMSARAPK